MSRFFTKQEAKVYLVSTDAFLLLHHAAKERGWARADEKYVARVRVKEAHLISPLIDQGNTYRCYLWLGLEDGTRVLQHIDLAPELLSELREPTPEGYRHLVNILLGNIPVS